MQESDDDVEAIEEGSRALDCKNDASRMLHLPLQHHRVNETQFQEPDSVSLHAAAQTAQLPASFAPLHLPADVGSQKPVVIAVTSSSSTSTVGSSKRSMSDASRAAIVFCRETLFFLHHSPSQVVSVCSEIIKQLQQSRYVASCDMNPLQRIWHTS